jgi:hypothetical protein
MCPALRATAYQYTNKGSTGIAPYEDTKNVLTELRALSEASCAEVHKRYRS